MKKSTKGAIAASAAGVLLLGGVGSLAYWTTDGEADGGNITAGTLALTDGICDPDWVYATGNANAGATVQLFVPGDVITKKCTFELAATGDNLKAELDAPASVTYTASTPDTSLDLIADTTFDVEGTPIADGGFVTSADDGDTITATFEVTVPFGTGKAAATKINANDMQGITATLDELTVTLTQVPA